MVALGVKNYIILIKNNPIKGNHNSHNMSVTEFQNKVSLRILIYLAKISTPKKSLIKTVFH